MRRFEMIWLVGFLLLLVVPGALMVFLGGLEGRVQIWLSGLTMMMFGIFGLIQLSLRQITDLRNRLASLERPPRG